MRVLGTDQDLGGWQLVEFLRSVRGSIKLICLFAYATVELMITRPATRQARAEWLHRFCGRVVSRMGLRMRVVGQYPERGVLISNHLSYVDIVIFAALHQCVFVSKAEIQSWPVLGWMTTMAGSVYVERGRGGSAQRAREGMQGAAQARLPVVFFPEGTTSNGETVLPFHRGLLGQAIEEGQPVTAAHLRYRLAGENPPGVTVEDDVYFWDDAPMLKHIFRLVGLRGIEAEVRIADAPIVFSTDAVRTKAAAEEARAKVMELGGVAESANA